MTNQEVQAAVEAAIGAKVLLTYPHLVLFVLLSAGGAWWGAYLKQKGQNFATEEDLKALTEKVEEVKAGYTKQIEDYKAELSRRAQAARIAEILAKTHYGKAEEQREFMELAWELSIWLPAERVRELSSHLVSFRNGSSDPRALLISVRKLLHGPEDKLSAEEIIQIEKPR